MGEGNGQASPLRCSFCNLERDDVLIMISAGHGVLICDQCVESCMEMVRENRPAAIGRVEYRSWFLPDGAAGGAG